MEGERIGEALTVIRAAVIEMQRHAETAKREPAGGDSESAALGAIQEAGRRAVAELRRLLGLLRTPAPAQEEQATRTRVRSPWRADSLIALGVTLLTAGEAAVWLTVAPDEFDPGYGPASVALSTALAATLALRRTDTTVACLLGTAPVTVAVAFSIPLVQGVGLAVTLALLAWTVGVTGRPRPYAALSVLALATLLQVFLLNEPGNVPMTAGAVVLPLVAGHLWAEQEREERSLLADAARLRATQQAAADEAVRAERLRLARELHDVVSHAIGVMVLQAGAAESLRARDAAAARTALAEVRSAGTQALSELDVLFGLLDAGAVGPPGLAATAPSTDLHGALAALVERVGGGGMRVDLVVDAGLAVDRATAATAYRVAQEALTNATRHAPGSTVRVSVFRDDEVLEITVEDDGPGGAPDEGGGFGLVGLAERVRAAGGTLATGPRRCGGFAVTARLPAARLDEELPA
jgi:signal transduction histidine kinase